MRLRCCYGLLGAALKTPTEQFEFTVPEEHAGQRLDRFLTAQLPEMTRSRVQVLMDEGRVRVDGAALKPSHRVAAGEVIVVEIPPAPPAGVEPEEIPLDVLYEDRDVAVINKPANMIVHPGAGADSGTMVAALLHRFGGMDGLSAVGGPLRPGIVHRLDKGTSGALLIARTNPAHKKLVDEFRDRRVEKTYVALLHGKVKGESGRIEMPIARDLRRRSRMTARRREGRDARTDWRIRLRLGAFSFVEADLHTGRTHQIRVHFSALGCPVVGDTLYGAPRQERAGNELLPPLARNFLHAARLAFEHPRTGKRMQFRAPLPLELENYLRELARATGTAPDLVDAALKEFL
ncbi:MAG TPA: RluA family pseudouridine synthase [Candidatus Acidoferrum sp.]|nr:RluA family pseudouridine synthase [Candidatus Acidoferrum sp.]